MKRLLGRQETRFLAYEKGLIPFIPAKRSDADA